MQELKRAIKSIGPVRRALMRRRLKQGLHGQSDEGEILMRLAVQQNAPKTFIEFGFHAAEFNCAELIHDFQGLLIDGNHWEVEDAKIYLPRSVNVRQEFLTLENIDFVRNAFPKLGILSIDVDGNDYWFLDALIAIEPTIISVEYNASFGLESVTVPYDPQFERGKKHPSGWYHGASLTALDKLARRHGYGLAAVASAGGNAFFTKDGRLNPESAWRPSTLRDSWSGTNVAQQWDLLKNMTFVWV